MRIKIADTEALLKDVFALREEVFVVEQQVARHEEFDEFEDISRHLIALDDEGKGLGVARWRETEKGIKLERFAVKKSARGEGVGSALVEATLKDIEQVKGKGHHLYLHAQLQAIPLYAKFGFKKVGEEFLECDIRHMTMKLDN